MVISTHQKFYLYLLQTKKMGQLINISPHSLTMMNTVNTEFSSVEVWFPDQASTELEIVVQKTAEATGDLIGNKIADKTTSIAKSKED